MFNHQRISALSCCSLRSSWEIGTQRVTSEPQQDRPGNLHAARCSRQPRWLLPSTAQLSAQNRWGSAPAGTQPRSYASYAQRGRCWRAASLRQARAARRQRQAQTPPRPCGGLQASPWRASEPVQHRHAASGRHLPLPPCLPRVAGQPPRAPRRGARARGLSGSRGSFCRGECCSSFAHRLPTKQVAAGRSHELPPRAACARSPRVRDWAQPRARAVLHCACTHTYVGR
jgi:hypothetical protein